MTLHRTLGIRHLRYLWHRLRLSYHLFLYGGPGYVLYPSPEDLAHLDHIWKGHA